jgi:hypothetical protein
LKPKPTRPCHICGSTDWWWRPASVGVNPSDVFSRARVKKWQDFTDFRDAWSVVEELVTERAEKPKMI